MGKLILEKVVQALKGAGIAALRGYPAGKMGSISQPVAAVNLQGADMRTKTVTILVSVSSPGYLGAAGCEEVALEVGEVLNHLGGQCDVGMWRRHEGSGLYMIQLTAVFAAQVPKITIGEQDMTHVTAFTSWRTLDETVTDWDNAKWNFRLEEYFPMGQEEEPEPISPFDLTHTCQNGTETYIDCTWTYQRRVWDASGIRQIRLGTAELMEVG